MEVLAKRPGLDTSSFTSGQLAGIRNVTKRVFSCCWHLKLSLPFTRGEETYQTCISCGARRRFELDGFASKVIVGPGQYRNAVASGRRYSINNRIIVVVQSLTRRYRVTVLTRPKRRF